MALVDNNDDKKQVKKTKRSYGRLSACTFFFTAGHRTDDTATGT
jgi:hypothetical protein